ncbi:MAG: efflux RND transporter periplasmic adaptor subunit [Pirellulaceae bacterium]
MSVTPARKPLKQAAPAVVIPLPTAGPVPLAWAGRRRRWVLPVVVCAGLVLLGLGLREVLSDSTKADESLVYYTVRRGTLPIVVTERGNLESQQTEEVTCEVENFGGDRTGQNGTQILFIVPNGSSVKKDDLLVELDSAPLKERLDAQFLALQRSDAEMIQANSKFDNQITQNETNLAEAELQVELCELEMKSYEDESGGTFQIELQNIEMAIQNARAEQLIRKSDFEAVEALYDLGYKSKGDLAAARLELLKADAALASNLAQSRQLQVYTYRMEKLDRQGKYDTAVNNCEQVRRNNESEFAQAKAAKESADRAYAKEKERYERYKSQLDKCKIYAPQDGMVAYATGDNRGNRGVTITEGAFIRERQQILSIPNLTHMQVNTAVHESVLDQVRPGLPATIRVDAFGDRTYQGTVKTVAVLPDQGGWLASDTKVYKTIVTIDQEVTQLKPGMTAVVEIDIEQLTNVLSVPIQAVVQRADKNWCYVRVNGQPEKREITLGKTNDKFVEIKQGLQDDEVVVLNPMSLIDEQNTSQREKENAEQKGAPKTDGADAEKNPAEKNAAVPAITAPSPSASDPADSDPAETPAGDAAGEKSEDPPAAVEQPKRPRPAQQDGFRSKEKRPNP